MPPAGLGLRLEDMFCEYFEAQVCRSCPLMGVPYSQQVRDKERASRRALASLDRPSSRRNPTQPPAAKSRFEWLPTYRSPQKEFRNKAKMVVSGSKKSIVLGLAPTKDFPAGVDLQSCPLYAPAIRAAFAPIRAWLQRLGARPYNIATAKGEVKYVLVSANPAGELMVRLVLRSKAALHRIENTWSELQAELPHLRVFSVNIQPEHTTVIEGREEIILSEEKYIHMPGIGTDLWLAPGAFFQTNTAASKAMYTQAAAWSRELQPETAWDLYCGVGGFAFALSSAGVAQVTGVEVVGPAIDGAKKAVAEMAGATAASAVGQGVEKTLESSRGDAVARPHFITADATKWATNQKLVPPDLVVVNPPRRGLGPELSSWLEHSGIPHLIYSSCFQETLVEDLRRMRSYRITAAKLVDMFPHTSHVETVVLMSQVK